MSFDLVTGTAPLLVSMPHLGMLIPEELRGDYVPRALDAEDTDWHLDRLYDWLPALGAVSQVVTRVGGSIRTPWPGFRSRVLSVM